MSVIRPTALCVVFLLSAGCFLQKKPAVTVPVAAPPAPSASPAPVPPSPGVPQKSVPPAGSAKSPRPAPPAPIKPAPALGAILTPEQRRQLDAAYQSDLREANLTLGKLSGRHLTSEQTDSVSRARAFIRQAAQYHDRDLTTAAELARRARVLTQDLAAALK